MHRLTGANGESFKFKQRRHSLHPQLIQFRADVTTGSEIKFLRAEAEDVECFKATNNDTVCKPPAEFTLWIIYGKKDGEND